MWPFARRPKVPYRDETLRCPYRRSVMRAMQKRDWKYARALLDVSDPDELAFLLQGVGRVDGVQDWIGEWVEAHRDSTLPLLVAGTHAVTGAW